MFTFSHLYVLARADLPLLRRNICDKNQVFQQFEIFKHKFVQDMFNRLLGKNSGNKKIGIYKLEGNKLIELDELPGNGSINSIIVELGYDLSHVRMVYTFNSKIIECIGVKIFSKEVVFLVMKDKSINLNLRILDNELNKVDWASEYSRDTIEDILNEGIEAQSLSLEFLSSVVKLKQEGDSLYLASNLDLYLHFKNGILESFTSSEWSNTASKWLKDLNKQMFEDILAEAMKYHKNEIEAMEEVNLQCEGIQEIPHVMKNEFIPMHIKSNGNINFYNLLATHYNKQIHIREFEIVNKGRFISKDEFTLEVDKFVFQFNTDGVLVGATKK